MFKKIFLLLLSMSLLSAFLLCGCGDSGTLQLSTYDDHYNPKEDFDPEAFSYFPGNPHYSILNEGIFLNAGNYLFYSADLKSPAKPFCSKTTCLHNEESDQVKIPACDAFTGLPDTCSFCASYNGKLYITQIGKTSPKSPASTVFAELSADGSVRKVLSPDLNTLKDDSICLHRGNLFYITDEYDTDGEKCSCIRAFSLKKKKGSVSLYKASDPKAVIQRFLPYGNSLFIEEVLKAGTADETSQLWRCDLKDGALEKISEDSMSLFGAYQDTLVLRKGPEYLLYSVSENKITAPHPYLNSFVEAHPEWNILPYYIGEDITLVSYFDFSPEVMDLSPDLAVIGADGELAAVIPGCGWSPRPIVPLTVNTEHYLIITSKETAPYSIFAYRKEDLINGITAPYVLLSVDDLSQDLQKSFILDQN